MLKELFPRFGRTLFVAGFLIIGLLGCEKTDADSGPAGAATSAASASSAADGHLSGLYIRQQSVPFFFNGRMTFSLQREFFYFFPDGHVLYGLPTEGNLKEHPTAADFAAFQKVDPALVGTYAIKDGKITFTRTKQKDTPEPFSIPKAGDDSVLQIGVPNIVGSCKAMPFKDGQKLDGVYQYDGTIGQGSAITIFNVNTLNFHPDGTLGSDQLSGVDTKGKEIEGGNNTGITTGGTTATAGTYHFNGYTLETDIGGKAVKATVFRWAGDDKPNPGMICISGRVYSHYKTKK